MKWFYINIFDFLNFANIWNILFKVQLWSMCEVIGYWYFWHSDFLLQYFSLCRYLTNSQQRTIVHAHQYVWSYQILIFLIFWYFCTFFSFCNYLKYPVQGAIVNACQYVWSYRILIFWEARSWYFNSWIGFPIHIWVKL